MKKLILAAILASMSVSAMATSLPNWDKDPSVTEPALRLECGDTAITVVSQSGQTIAFSEDGQMFAAVSQITFSSSHVTAFAPLNKAGGAITGKAGFMVVNNIETDSLYSLFVGNIQTACNVRAIKE